MWFPRIYIFSRCKSLKKSPFSLWSRFRLRYLKYRALSGDHQRFSVERSFTLDPESWVAQRESRSYEEGNTSGSKVGWRRRGNDEGSEMPKEGKGYKKREEAEGERELEGRKRESLHWIVWHSREPAATRNHLLTLRTLLLSLYCIFKAWATCTVDAILLKNIRSRCIRTTEEATSRTGPGDGSWQRAPSKGTVFAIACIHARRLLCFIYFSWGHRYKCTGDCPRVFWFGDECGRSSVRTSLGERISSPLQIYINSWLGFSSAIEVSKYADSAWFTMRPNLEVDESNESNRYNETLIFYSPINLTSILDWNLCF